MSIQMKKIREKCSETLKSINRAIKPHRYTICVTVICIVVAILIGVIFYEMSAVSRKKITDEILKNTLLKDWDWVAIIIAFVSLVFALLTYNSQRNTETNTMNISLESQQEILIDLIRHFYRNLVIISAIEQKLGGRYDTHYPSQEHILKLKVDIEDLHPSAFYNHVEQYKFMHELQMKIANFNTECDVAVMHLCDQHLITAAKERDFKTLKFKMAYLAQETYNTIAKIYGKEVKEEDKEKNKGKKESETKYILDAKLDEEIRKHIEKQYNEEPKPGDINFVEKKRMYDDAKAFSTETDSYYFKDVNCFFVKQFYPQEKHIFLSRINFDIYMEMFCPNGQGSEKIMIIPFA